MSRADAVAGVLWAGATLYAVLAGADFGAGLWTLLAGRSERGARARGLIQEAIAPVWEANHVWLIFVLVVLWTGFPDAFGAVMSTLYIPLSLAGLGIVLRGAGFAFGKVGMRLSRRRLADMLFAASSILTPFFMGTVVGGIASGRVPAGDAGGDAITSWANATGILVGVLFVATGAYLAAVFLTIDARRLGDAALERYFAARAAAAAIAAGCVALAGVFVLHSDARFLYDGLVHEGLPLVLASGACGLGVLALLARRARRGLRPLAALAVAAIVWGWGVAQYPYLLPQDLTIASGAGSDASLTALLVVFGAAVVLVLPSLALLFTVGRREP
jgi:cytochrome d ubiquinol oxidase subunit II